MTLVSREAAAQGSIAEQLFLEGKTLMQAGQTAEACAKFKASYELDVTATGTLLNLALCHEKLGRSATAWGEFRIAAAKAAEAHRQDRVEMAREHEGKLRPLLSYAVFVVPSNARATGLTLLLDHEVKIAEAAWGIPVPVDPGPHTIEVSAPNKVAATQTFDATEAQSSRDVVVAPLVDAPSPPVTTADPGRPARRALAFALGGASVIGLGMGTFFGIRAIGKNQDAKNLCPNDHCASVADKDTASSTLGTAHTSATISNVALAGGALLAAAGIVLYVTSSPSSTRVGLTTNGVTLSGAW